MGKFSVLASVSFVSAVLSVPSPVQAFTYQTPPASMSYHNGPLSEGTSVKTDSQGNMYVSVTSSGENGKIIKYDPSGQSVWVRDFDPNNPRPADKSLFVVSTGISAVAIDRNDNIYAVGESYNGSSLDCLLKKFNVNGDIIWQTRYSVPMSGTSGADQYCSDITIDKAGDIIAGGTSLSFTGTYPGAYGNQILKWDANGTLLGKFNTATNGMVACGAALPCQSQILNVITDLNQNIYTLEKSHTTLGTAYAKYSPGLQFQTATYLWPSNFHPVAIAVDTQGHVFGNGYELSPNSSGGTDKYNKLVSMDGDLNKLCEDKRLIDQSSTPLRSGDDYFHAIAIGSDEMAYLAGTENHDFTVLPYNSQCQPQWLDANGAPAPLIVNVDYWDFSNAVTLDSDNNLIIAGNYLKSDLLTIDAATVKFTRVVTPVSSDLVVGGAYSDSTNFKTGQTATVKGYFMLTGNLLPDVNWLGLYLSTDDYIISRQDILLSRTGYENLVPGIPTAINVTGKIPANLPTGAYYLGVLVDDGNLIAETNETNNDASFLVQYTALPDLVAVSGSAPATAAAGQQIAVTATFKNQGFGAATIGSAAGIYISSDSSISASDTLICTAAVGPLAAGASQTVSCTGTIPLNTYGGNVYVGVLADRANAVEETNEENNGWSQPFILTALPDLVISTAVTPASVMRGQQITVSGTVMNQGYGAAGYFWVRMFLSVDNVITLTDMPLCTVGFGATSANTTLPFSCSATIPATLTAGNYYVGFFADSSNSVVESNEANNIKVNSIVITQ